MGKCTLTAEGHVMSEKSMMTRLRKNRYRTDWTGLKHELPYERIGASFI